VQQPMATQLGPPSHLLTLSYTQSDSYFVLSKITGIFISKAARASPPAILPGDVSLHDELRAHESQE